MELQILLRLYLFKYKLFVNNATNNRGDYYYMYIFTTVYVYDLKRIYVDFTNGNLDTNRVVCL